MIRNDEALFAYLKALGNAYLISDEKTREREFGNLMTIQDNYPKYVVSLDEFNRGSDVEGIIHLHLADFLKREVL